MRRPFFSHSPKTRSTRLLSPLLPLVAGRSTSALPVINNCYSKIGLTLIVCMYLIVIMKQYTTINDEGVIASHGLLFSGCNGTRISGALAPPLPGSWLAL